MQALRRVCSVGHHATRLPRVQQGVMPLSSGSSLPRSFSTLRSSSASSRNPYMSSSSSVATSVRAASSPIANSPSSIFTRYSRTYATQTVASKYRNVAIIAHVDHGKTSLVDQLLKQSGSIKLESSERVMDSNQLEKERGITILAKCTSLQWGDHQLNIVDTPGHGDFGGEVERVLGMVDGVVLLVDATEGPMAQTKFVLSKALKAGLKPVVVLNKMDRNTIRSDEVENEIFDLFAALEASDAQLDYPTLYASAREGWAIRGKTDERKGMNALFDTIISYVPPPTIVPGRPFTMLATTLESDPFLGRIVTGKVYSGTVKAGMPLKVLDREGKMVEEGKVIKVLGRRGMDKVVLEEGTAGDIVGIAGFGKSFVTNSLVAPDITEAIPAQPIDPPVLAMTFSVNTSPLAGKEGSQITSTKLKARLYKELESNVSMTVEPARGQGEAFEVKGRGELQMGILIENMRREGFEMSVSQPRVVFKKEDRELMEPIEEVTIDVDQEFSGGVMQKMMKRKADIIDMKQSAGKSRLVFRCPSRGLIGFRAELINDTRGTAVLNHLFSGYEPYKGQMEGLSKGAIVSLESGLATAYALETLQDRGVLFITPQTKVYQGMVIGEHSRDNDIDVNPAKSKALSNVRTVMKDDFIKLNAPRLISLETAIAAVKEDELIEVTPLSIRLRKREVDPGARARQKKKNPDALPDID
eukprot:TRINITY_DN5366_c0_g1_i1.p1 TRINITY_DN5366_c0_g1~~TRINITY_DN5366_c0_g1_i1.p1  ORF type:complete len:699 (-),score=235.40 TRINITY_DN5366_c0_g1_i1:59-2155(-)